MKSLKIAPGVALPARVATESNALLGMRGAGKSNAAVVLAEEMFDAGVAWVAVDPKGDWWGIRSSSDGKHPGLPIPVFGGLHGDAPLESDSGQLVADLIVDENLTAVLDVSDFSKGERARFLVAFFDRLYQRHRREPQPRHVFLEEAHEYIPQQVTGDTARLKDSASRIVLMGRSFGLGSTLCSQRSARIHKDVLTQTDTLIPMRNTSPQDRKAILAWVEEHDAGAELVASLPALKSGEAYIWSPHALGETRRIRFRSRRTFDSGATPIHGQRRKAATIADVNLKAIRERMAAAIEKAKADDPRELRRRISDLERQLRERPAVEPERIEVPVLTDEDRTILRAASDKLAWFADEANQAAVRFAGEVAANIETLSAAWASIAAKLPDGAKQGPQTSGGMATRQMQTGQRTIRSSPEAGTPHVERRSSQSAGSPPAGSFALGAGERKILAAVVQHGQVTREQLTVLTGYKRSSRDTYLQRLKAAGLIEPAGDGGIGATPAGRQAIPDVEPLPTGSALRVWWLDRLSGGEREILAVLIRAWPRGVTRDAISDQTGYKRSSRDTYLQRLRARQLIEADTTGVTASPILFDEGAA